MFISRKTRMRLISLLVLSVFKESKLLDNPIVKKFLYDVRLIVFLFWLHSNARALRNVTST